MPILKARFALVVLGLIASSTLVAKPPTSFPEFDIDSASSILVVAKIRPGKYLPQFYSCSQPNVICMDPEPFWFKAKVKSTVFGSPQPKLLHVATTSHYGMSELRLGKKEQLVLIKTDGQQFVMPRYAKLNLTKNGRGEYFIIVLSDGPTWWLPCSVQTLREEINQSDFSFDLEISQSRLSDDVLKNHRELFHFTAERATPKFGISVTKLSEHLNSIPPSSLKMSCKQDD